MDFCYFVGIDIAKDTLDWAICTQQGVTFNTHTDNTIAGMKIALTQLKALPGWTTKQAVFCMEHTGLYNAHLLELRYELKLPIWLESSLQIKQAVGMQRAKLTKWMPDVLLNMHIGFAIRCGFGNHQEKLFRNLPSWCYSATLEPSL